MANYRLYFVNAGGHFSDVIDVEAVDDDEAINTAEDNFTGRAMELWQRARCVKIFETTA